MALTTWRKEIERRMEVTGEAWEDVVAIRGDIDARFDNGRYRSCPPEVSVWTARFVYLPVWIEGHPRAGSVPRDPPATNMVARGSRT